MESQWFDFEIRRSRCAVTCLCKSVLCWGHFACSRLSYPWSAFHLLAFPNVPLTESLAFLKPKVNHNVCTCTLHLMAAGQVNIRPLHGLDHAVYSGNYVGLTHDVLIHIGVTINSTLQIKIPKKKNECLTL